MGGENYPRRKSLQTNKTYNTIINYFHKYNTSIKGVVPTVNEEAVINPQN
jgi:hypothetical protein